MRGLKGQTSRKLLVLTALMAMLPAAAQLDAQRPVPKQVHLVVDGDRLVASNVRFSRFDDLKLMPRERIVESSVGEAVIIIATNQRILGYGAVSGWRVTDRNSNEEVVSIAADDFAGLVITSQRLLNFNGESGIWAEHDRSINR